MDFSSFNITHSGQKWSVINRAIKLFNDEHNEHSLGVAFRESRGILNNLLPAQYHSKRVVWLKTFWGDVLPDIDEADRDVATASMSVAYGAYRLFAKYQRNEYHLTLRRLLRDRFVAEQECEEDTFHNPNYIDFQTNGLPSKNPNANPSTNIAYLKRLGKLNVLTEDQKEEIEKAKRDMRQISHDDDYWDSRGLSLDDLRLTVDIPMPPDPLEDYTPPNYTETDPDSEVTVATNTITVSGMGKNTDTLVYKDFGSGHFTDFDHLHHCKITAWQTSAFAAVYMLADTVNDYLGARASNIIAVVAGKNIGGGAFRLDQSTGGSWSGDTSLSLTLNVDYYFDTARTG
ncbi:hypothetical protein KAR91_81090, partial [Candidatus Pacearchaeota archaeon]|nr:hypothetical protein [Candidatus Pacearchaeota archaeon]